MDLIRNTKEKLSKTKLSYINGYIGNKHIDIEITRWIRSYSKESLCENNKKLTSTFRSNDGYGINPQKLILL